ncbi:MAG: hypothetical protein ACHQ7N_16700 [Candidatus Methylomirabilales bacterium]
MASGTPETLALLDRYYHLVEESRLEWEALYARECYREPGLHGIDLTKDHVAEMDAHAKVALSKVIPA